MIVRYTREDLLALTLGDLALAQRLTRESAAPDAPRDVRCSLGGWSGQSSGRSDATAAQVRLLWSLLTDPHAGDKSREGFVRLLAAQPIAGDADDFDADRARRATERLARAEGLRHATLVTLGRYCRPTTPWDTAAGVVADQHAPPEVRAYWTTTYRRPQAGRPTRDPSGPPPEVVRLEWGGGLLEEVVRWWCEVGG